MDYYGEDEKLERRREQRTMKNGGSVLKLLGIIFLCIGIAGIPVGILFMVLMPGEPLFGIIFGGIMMVFLIPGGICLGIHIGSHKKREELISAGKHVFADVVDIDELVNVEMHYDRQSIHPYVIICKYVDATGKEYQFKSKYLMYNPSALVDGKRLKVYVDLSKPRRYYVDTNSILPETAVLHKFKVDTKGNEKRLEEGGQYVWAETCGVELIGRIKVSGLMKPTFVKLSENVAEKLNIPVDEKNRAYFGYKVLCKFTAPDGVIHIFASREMWGEPENDYVGQRVKVYYGGADYKKYHVDLESLEI